MRVQRGVLALNQRHANKLTHLRGVWTQNRQMQLFHFLCRDKALFLKPRGFMFLLCVYFGICHPKPRFPSICYPKPRFPKNGTQPRIPPQRLGSLGALTCNATDCVFRYPLELINFGRKLKRLKQLHVTLAFNLILELKVNLNMYYNCDYINRICLQFPIISSITMIFWS